MFMVTMILSGKETKGTRFFVGNRKMGYIRAAMSIAATWIWAPALFVSAEKAYLNGWLGLFWFLVPNILCLLFFIPFAKKIRRLMPQGITLAGFMEERYQSKRVKNIYLFQLGTLSVLSTAVQLLAGGKILSSITGIPFFWITILLGMIAYSYSQFSGIQASVITDCVQMVFMLLVCFLLVPWAFNMEHGISSVISGLHGVTGDFTRLFDRKGLEVFFAFGLPTAIGLISGPFGDQCFWQRAFAIRKNQIGKAFLLGALLFAIIPLSMGILGFIAAGSGYAATDSGIVNFELVGHIFPSWCMVLFLIMVISGLLSTIDSNLCAAASLTTDITKRMNLRLPRAAMIVLLLFGTAIANIPKISVTHLFLIYGTLRATTLLPTVMTLKGKKLSADGVYYGVLFSLLVGLPIFAYGTLFNISLYKTTGSIITVLLSGFIAFFTTKRGGKQNEICIREKADHKK